MPARVLDSFALIAYFRDEPGAEAVETLLVTAGKKDTPLHRNVKMVRGAGFEPATPTVSR